MSTGRRGPQRSAQRQAADAAGLSRHQRRQALAVASLPTEEFEALVESETPPSVTELARLGAGKPARRLNTKRKGTRAERRAIRLLEAAGYLCTKAGGSLGLFDVIAIGAVDVKAVQVKSGGEYLSAIEREQIAALVVPANVSRECWRFPDRCRAPGD